MRRRPRPLVFLLSAALAVGAGWPYSAAAQAQGGTAAGPDGATGSRQPNIRPGRCVIVTQPVGKTQCVTRCKQFQNCPGQGMLPGACVPPPC